MSDALRLLTALFGPDDSFGWRATDWNAAPRRARFDLACDLDPRRLDELLSTGLGTYPQVSVVDARRRIDPAAYTRARTVAGLVLHALDADGVQALVREGATIQIKRIEWHDPSLADLVEALEEELGLPISINAFVSPAGGSGLPTHVDPGSTIALQVSGRKRWEVGRYPGKAGRFLRDPQLMVPGDVLYLPAGWPHRAIAEGPSLSLSMNVAEIEGLPVAWPRSGVRVPDEARRRFSEARLVRDRFRLASLFDG